ncbi:MAG: hypothetical protein WDN49_18415 [Acetobacteraceae bacterium]
MPLLLMLPPPRLLRVSLAVPPRVGNRLARASSTMARDVRYDASASFKVWFDTSTCRSSPSSVASW